VRYTHTVVAEDEAERVVPSSQRAKTVGQVFAERLRELRKRRGLTQETLARRLTSDFGYPIHRATLARIEAGSTRGENVTVKDLFAVAAALNVAPVYLITGADDEALLMVTPDTEVPSGRVRDWTIGANVLRADLDNEAEYHTTRPPAEVAEIVRDARVARRARGGRTAADTGGRTDAGALPGGVDDGEPEVARPKHETSRRSPRGRRVTRPPAQGPFAWREDGHETSHA